MIKRPIGASFIALAFVVLGILSFLQLPQNLMPEIQPSTVVVQIEKSGATESELEAELVDKLEDQFSSISGLISSESFIRPEKAELLLHFRADIDINSTIERLREKMSTQRFGSGSLPPKVLRYDPDLDPVLRYTITTVEGGDLVTVSEAYRDKLLPKLEALPEVASVRLRGQKKLVLKVTPDYQKLLNYAIEPSELKRIITEGVSKTSLGRIDTIEGERTLQIKGAAVKVADVSDLSVRSGIVMSDIAEVALVLDTPEEMVYYKDDLSDVGQEALVLEIMAHRDIGMVPLSNAVKQALGKIVDDGLVSGDSLDLFGAKMKLLSDTSEPVKETISEVSYAVLYGAILALVVLFIFMQSFRASMIIFISVPLSTVISFLFMNKWDVGLNLMSLSGLALGIGMLVDNAIVVLESINKKREEGKSIFDASYMGSKEVIPAVIASTLTTVAVFFPLTFIEGNLGDLLFDQAFTVSVSLLISLVVAIVLVPTFMALPDLMNTKESKMNKSKSGTLLNCFKNSVNYLIDRPALAFLMMFCLFILIYLFSYKLNWSTMPPVPVQSIEVEIKLNDEMNIYESQQWVKDFLNSIEKNGPAFKCLGIDGESIQYARIYGKRERNEILLLFIFENPFFDKFKLQAWMKSFEKHVYRAGAVEVRLTEVASMDIGLGDQADLDVVMSETGDLFQEELQRDFIEYLKKQGAMGVSSTMTAQKNEILIIPDSLKLKGKKISLSQFNQRLNAALLESQIEGFFPEYEGVDSPMMLKVILEGQEMSSSLSDFEQINIGSSAKPVFLGEVAVLKNSVESKVIYHLNGSRVFRVKASRLPKELSLNQIKAWFESKLDGFSGMDVLVKAGTSNLSGGVKSLIEMFALSIFLIIVIMAVQFESVLQPFLVIFSIPMALAGSLGLLWVSSNGINIMSGIGIVILVGVAVNNAIVLVSTVNQKIQEGLEVKEAILSASISRLRPILMTALTTISGLLPLLIGASASSALKAPLAIAVIGGLFSSTFLVLFILPSIINFFTKKTKVF